MSVNGAQVASATNKNKDGIPGDDYDTAFGVKLAHDGSNANAFIPNLNFVSGFR